MNDLINQILRQGDDVEIIYADNTSIKATFVKASSDALLVESDEGMMVVRYASVSSVLAPRKQIRQTPTVVEKTAEETSDQKAVAAEAEAEEAAESLADVSDSVYHAEAPDDSENPAEPMDEDDPDSDVFSPIVGPKVVGKIDLDAIVDPRRKRPHIIITPSENNPLVPAGGVVSSIGPAFGFIKSADGQNLYFGRGEVMQRNRNEELQLNTPVVFTPGRNDKGGVAKCVHVQMTMQEQLEWIERIEQYDSRNARMLAQQLLTAFPDDSDLAETLSQFNISHQAVSNPRARAGVPVADKVLSDVEHGLYVEPADLLRAEKEIAATKPYEEAMARISDLLEFAKTNSRPQCYQLFVRLTKLARQEGEMERCREILTDAIDFYSNEAGSKTYFEGLLRKTSAENVEENTGGNVSQAIDKLMSSIKTNVALVSDDPAAVNSGIDEIYEVLSPIPEYVVFKLADADIPDESDFERRFFYQLFCALNKAVADKFDTEFAMPSMEAFLGEGVSEFSAMGEFTRGVKSLRAMLAERQDSIKKKLHIICMIPDFSKIIDGINAGRIPDNFVRHYKAISETPGTSLQSAVGCSSKFFSFVETPANRGAFKTFTTISLK